MAKQDVLIVGYGASAMYAVLACNSIGIKPVVVAKKPILVQPGAFWLKWLPGSLQPKFRKICIAITSVGTREGYITKQWGDEVPPNYASSFPYEPSLEYGWNPYVVMQHVLENESLLDLVETDSLLTDNDLLSKSSEFKYVFHTFPLQRIQARMIEDKVFVKASVIGINTDEWLNEVVYNGTPNNPIVRRTSLFGYTFYELSPGKTVENLELPVGTSPTIHWFTDIRPTANRPVVERLSSNIIPIGRLARVNRVLQAHDTYSTVLTELNS